MLYSQFKIFSSADSGSPVLSGTNGSLVTVLSASLVGGYAGIPSAGWSLVYTSSTSQGAAFRPPSGSRFYLSVDDRALGTGGAKEARVAGFETLTDWNTGSYRFPPISASIRARKSSVTTDSPRPWTIFADAYTMYMFVYSDDTTTLQTWMFGDIFSMMGEKDAYRCMLMAGFNENSTSENPDTLVALGSAIAGHWMARRYSGTSGSLGVGKFGDGSRGSTVLLAGSLMYPNGPDKSIHMSPVWVHEGTISSCIRGKMRGFWQICHPVVNFANGQVLEGMGESLGRKFIVMKQGASAGMFLMEISPTVETN